MAEQLANDMQGQMQCVTFNLEDETYGIDVMQVRQVLRVIEVVPVPGAPHYVSGIINLRGNVGNDETARYIDGVVSGDDRLPILVDLNKLLAEAELGESASI